MNNCEFRIKTIAVTKNGKAGTEHECWDLMRGDFYFTVDIKGYPWSKIPRRPFKTSSTRFLDFILEMNEI